jgi:hypothetical protein
MSGEDGRSERGVNVVVEEMKKVLQGWRVGRLKVEGRRCRLRQEGAGGGNWQLLAWGSCFDTRLFLLNRKGTKKDGPAAQLVSRSDEKWRGAGG